MVQTVGLRLCTSTNYSMTATRRRRELYDPGGQLRPRVGGLLQYLNH